MPVVSIVLLLAAVGGVLFRPPRVPAWLIPLVCALVALGVEASSVSSARRALEPLAEPIAFLLAAVPLAVGLVATTVGWWCYQRVLDPDRAVHPSPDHGDVPERNPHHPHALRIGGIILTIVLIGFVGGSAIGVEPWVVALAADVALVMILRRTPWRDIPVGTALIVASLGVLAASAVAHLPIERVVGGVGTTALARTIATTALASNLINNLPALLVALPFVDEGVTPALWAVLIGVNVGPVVLVTGSLASLLWLDALNRLDVEVRPRDFTSVGIRVGLPAGTAGAATFLLLNAIA